MHIADNASAEANNKPAVDDGGQAKPAVGESGGKPIVVLPVYQDGASIVLWDDPNPWREAWGQRSSDLRGLST